MTVVHSAVQRRSQVLVLGVHVCLPLQQKCGQGQITADAAAEERGPGSVGWEVVDVAVGALHEDVEGELQLPLADGVHQVVRHGWSRGEQKKEFSSGYVLFSSGYVQC